MLQCLLNTQENYVESCSGHFGYILFLICSMDDRPQRIADYFVVVGLGGSSATRFEPFPLAGDLELGVAVDPAPGGHSGCEGAGASYGCLSHTQQSGTTASGLQVSGLMKL